MGADLSGVRKKLDRAKFHLNALNAEVDKAAHPSFYRLDAKPDSERGYWLVQVVSGGSPGEWPLILGDILNNLRSALDHLVWQLVVANGRRPSGNYFPVAFDEPRFDSKVNSYLAGVHNDAVEAIRSLQPFRVSDEGQRQLDPLWLLSKLSNVDKHRLVHVITFVANEATLHFDERFRLNPDDVEFFPLVEGMVENGTKIARIRAARQPKMEMDSRLVLSIFIEATDKTPRLEWGAIEAMLNAVDDAMRALAPFVVWPPK